MIELLTALSSCRVVELVGYLMMNSLSSLPETKLELLSGGPCFILSAHYIRFAVTYLLRLFLSLAQ